MRLRKSSLVGLLAVVVASACNQEMPREFVEVPPDSTSSGALTGYWRWVSSVRQGEVRRPTTPAESLVFRIGPYGGYQERAGEATLTTRYWFADGYLTQTQDSSFTVLLMDSSLFFRRSVEDYHGVAVRQFDGRTLFLSGTGTDATLHTFIRVVPASQQAGE